MPENLRICPFCQLNEVEHEFDFLFSFQLYNNLRSKFFADINKRYPHFNDLDKNLKIGFLFNNVDPFYMSLYSRICSFMYGFKTISCNLMYYMNIYCFVNEIGVSS